MALDKKGVVTNVIGTVVGTGIIGTFTQLTDIGRSWLNAAQSWISILWQWLIEKHSISGWILTILFAISVTSVLRIIMICVTSRDPDYYSYTSDEINGARWKWRWSEFRICNLWGYCPHCDGTLVYDDSACSLQAQIMSKQPVTKFRCERCQNLVATFCGGDKNYALGFVQREIERRVRTGEYKTKS